MTNDAFLFYNAGDWKDYGLAVPNCGTKTHSQNGPILNLVQTCGRNLSAMMWHPDSRLRTPPSVNTLERIHKLCVRARQILASRAVPSGTKNLEPAHALPAPEVFIVHPVPYFKVRNSWMKDYCGMVLLALTEAMQHQENARPLEISNDFAEHIGKYIQRIYRQMCTELLQIPAEQTKEPGFTLTLEQLRGYNPAAWFTPTEMIDTVPDLEGWPTENDLVPLTDGIPVTMLPDLGRYPNNPQASAAAIANGNANMGSDGSVWIQSGI